jgi:transposase
VLIPLYVGEFNAYDTKRNQWRHLNFFQHECYLHRRVPRIKPAENKIEIISTPWEGQCPGFTLLFEALVLEPASHMPVLAVSGVIGETDDKIWRMLNQYVDKAREHEDFSELVNAGMDETSRAKGHDYISLFVDPDRRRTVFVTEGKDHGTVDRFAEDLRRHNGSPDNIENISCDMSPAFIKGANENFKNASITFDKFHILKIINEGVDSVRRQEAASEPILKNTKYIFLKNEENLTEKQQETLGELKMPKLNLKTVRALHIRQNFQDIYRAETFEEFQVLLRKWYFWAIHSRLEPIIKAAKTIKNHWDGVLAWFQSKINNGILEGLNSVVQAAKRKARGFKTPRNFKTIVYLITGDLKFKLVNPYVKED